MGGCRLLLPTASTRPLHLGGSLLGLLEGSAPGGSSLLLLTVTHSLQALLCPLRLPPVDGWTPGWEGREESCTSPAEERGSGWLWACSIQGSSDPFIRTVRGLAFWDSSSPRAPCFGPPTCAPHLKIDPDAGSGDHIMRQTPVCPARQWEPPPALTGTMTSDL